ncbi:MAG: hypothetical protein U0893_02205 [Chloroflexota bacterium]
MRAPAADYLEAAKVEDLIDELHREGYQVEREATVGNETFDLSAQRNGELLVYEVKARSRLKESGDELARLREAAIEAGVSGFRLVVVNPPHEIEVAVEGLKEALASHFLEKLPPAVEELSANTCFQGVSHVYIDAVSVRRMGAHVRGTASIDVQLNFRGKTDRIDWTVDERLPFTFDVELGHDLKLARVNEIKIDLSDFADADE